MKHHCTVCHCMNNGKSVVVPRVPLWFVLTNLQRERKGAKDRKGNRKMPGRKKTLHNVEAAVIFDISKESIQ